MTTHLYVDTETSDYHEDSNPSLPVQIAAVLATETRSIATLSAIISQRCWQGIRLNPIAERVITGTKGKGHGITPAVCDTYGWPPDLVISRLRWMAERAAAFVAHNAEFDVGVIDHVCSTQRVPKIHWESVVCTMREAAPIMKQPGYGRYTIQGYKAPKLTEAVRYFTGQELAGAHDALVDVYGCRKVHLGILRHRAKNLEEEGILK